MSAKIWSAKIAAQRVKRKRLAEQWHKASGKERDKIAEMIATVDRMIALYEWRKVMAGW
jgi:hypothetical protein